MILYRRINDDWVRNWERHKLDGSIISDPKELPFWAIHSFLLSKKDLEANSGLSLFALKETSELSLVTAALSLKANIDTASFAGVEMQKIRTAGFSIKHTESNTRIADVDNQHYEIEIRTTGEIAMLTMLFLNGAFEKVQKNIIGNTRQNAARTERIEFCKLANDNNTTGNTRLAGFIGEIHISVTGADKL